MSNTQFAFSDAEILTVLEVAELELLHRGWCREHLTLDSGEICLFGALNIAIFGDNGVDTAMFFWGTNAARERLFELRTAVIQRLGFGDALSLIHFNDQQHTRDQVLHRIHNIRRAISHNSSPEISTALVNVLALAY